MAKKKEIPTQVKKERLLKSLTLEELIDGFYKEFNHQSYVGELFDMIPKWKLKKWLIELFDKEFNYSSLKEVFSLEEDDF